MYKKNLLMQSFCFCLPESSSQFGANCKIRPRISAQKFLSSDEDVSEPVSFLPFVGFPHSGCASCDAEGYIALWVKQKRLRKKNVQERNRTPAHSNLGDSQSTIIAKAFTVLQLNAIRHPGAECGKSLKLNKIFFTYKLVVVLKKEFPEIAFGERIRSMIVSWMRTGRHGQFVQELLLHNNTQMLKNI